MGYIPAFSKDNEFAAWKHIYKAADAALEKYPTTLEEDHEILSTERNEYEKLGKNKTNCVIYRYTEKIILHFLKDCALKIQ